MLKDQTLNVCIVSLEGVLKLDYGNDKSVEDILKTAKEALENTYSITIDRSIYDVQAVNQLSAKSVDIFLNDLQSALQQLALFVSMAVYTKKPEISLANVNYLGFAAEKLITSIKYIMDEDLYRNQREKIIPSLISSLNNIQLNSVKRLFIILLMLDSLGVYDGANVVAQELYLGGLVT